MNVTRFGRLVCWPLALSSLVACGDERMPTSTESGTDASDVDGPESNVDTQDTAGSDAIGPDDVPASACIDNDNDSFFAVGCATVAANQLDCDDNNAQINPAAREICDGIDNNCSCDRTNGDTNADGVVCSLNDDGVDENLTPRSCVLDAGVCAGASIGCINGVYPVFQCDELGAYPDTYEPGDETRCDALDNDCDGQVDEGACG